MLSMATTYYVSSSGSDSNSGLTTTLAWKTIAKVNSATFKPGDQILFQKGDTFYGGINVNQSGSSSNPIVYGAYGAGPNPIITGLTAVTSWTSLGGNIWESTTAVSTLSKCNVVVINGELTPMGRYPNLNAANSGYLRITSQTATSITNTALSGTPNFTGAECVTRTHNTRLDRTLISSQSGSTIILASANSYFTNWGFFIQNSPVTLDAQNEWYYNPNTKKIQVYSVGQPTDVKVASVTKLVNLGSVSHLTFENIAFQGANEYAIQHWVGGDATRYGYTVRNCSIYFTGVQAILINNADIVLFDNNSVYFCNGIAAQFMGVSHLKIRNNDFQNNGLIRGADTDGGAYGAISFMSGLSTLVENNTIINTGNNGITFDGDSIMIRNNFIDTFNQIIDDGAGITGGGRSDKSINTGNTVTGNIIINGLGAKAGTNAADGETGGQSNGIYTADRIAYLTVSNNSIYNCAYSGLYITWCDYTYVTGNNVYNCPTQLRFKIFDAGTYHRVVSDNILVSKTSSQIAAEYNYVNGEISKIGVLSNNVYARPLGNNVTIREWNQVGAATTKTIEQWQAFSGLDLDSHPSPVSITSENDIQFEYNASKTAKTVSLSKPMVDAKGIKYATSVILQPYTSVVLMKDPNPAVVTDATAPVVNAFAIPTSSTSLTVSVSSLSASDNIGVTGYLITESSSAPTATASGWSSTIPPTYIFTAVGSKSLYAWAKDAAGNVSSPIKADILISNPIASTFTLTGPLSGNVNSASSNFTVTPNNLYTGSITITPSGSGSIGLSAKVLSFSNSSTAQTFTITPTVSGIITLTATNNGSLTNPASLNYTANALAPGAPTSVIASAGNKTASVTFLAPLNNGGLANLVYTVTSIPSGGTDVNAGTNSLTHSISGLINGTSYTFTVKAVNSAGTSAVSAVSNAVIPTALTSTEYKSICDGSNYNGWTVTGKYLRTLVSKSGGDSIVTTYLTVNPKYSVNEDITINNGDNYKGWTISGQYIRVLTSLSGCDSIVTTNLTVATSSGKDGQIINPSHFTPVWQGQTGQNLMNFVVKSALLEDQPLGIDDEIAVFSGSLCVGSKKITQAINPLDENSFLSFQASQNTVVNNGYNTNDTIIFRIWDNKNKIEKSIQIVSYQQGNSPVITNGKYTALATAIVSIECFTEYTQTISLIKGNNLISSNLLPANSDFGQIMKSLCDAGALYKVQDEAGLSMEYWGRYGGWINKIGNLSKTEGYNVNVKFNCSLEIRGRKVSLPLDIPLRKGWNFISFPQTEQINAMNVVQSLIDQNMLVKVMDEKGNSIEKLKGYGWTNNIGNFTPGKGYKVYVSGNVNFTIQQSYPKSAVILAQTQNTEYFSSVVVGNGTGHMNINIVSLNESGLSEGDELAVYDGNICVGALKINENNISSGIACLVASLLTDDQNPNGYKVGNQISIYSWNKNTNEKSLRSTEIVEGELIFTQNASVVLKMTTITKEVNTIKELVQISVFPNPCRGNFTVRMSEIPKYGSRIEILDMSGRIISSREVTEQSEAFQLDRPVPGMYLVKTILGTYITVNKLIVNN
jgi:hypothetical protein